MPFLNLFSGRSKERAMGSRVAEDKVYVASQTQLMWWKFRRHRAAVACVVLVGILYGLALFADFVAPYDPNETDTEFLFVPPRGIHFFGPDGFHAQPFIYGIQVEVDEETYRKTYTIDKSVTHPVRFLVKGSAYEMWGLFEGDLHLFGLEEGKGLFLLGTDKQGPDVFSRMTDSLLEARVDLAEFTVLTPFPGTPFFDQMKKEGRLLHEDWGLYNAENVVLRPLRMTPGQLEDGYRACWERFYEAESQPARMARLYRMLSRSWDQGVGGAETRIIPGQRAGPGAVWGGRSQGGGTQDPGGPGNGKVE